MEDKCLNNPYIKTVIEYTKKNYLDDIDIIVLYGSFLSGKTHQYSDIDLFFIPCNPRGYQANFTAIIAEIGYDFFPISWDRLNRIAEYKDSLTSLLLNGKVIYAKNTSVLEKFESFRTKCKEEKDFLRLAKDRIDKTKRLFFDFPESLSTILSSLVEGLCLYNKTIIKKSSVNFENELIGKEVPDNFIEKVKSLIDNPNQEYLKELIIETEFFISKNDNHQQNLETGFYEELKSIYQKALSTNDKYQRFFIKSIIDNEINGIFGSKNTFPKIKEDFNSWIKEHENHLIEKLKEANVRINTFSNIDEFRKKFLQL